MIVERNSRLADNSPIGIINAASSDTAALQHAVRDICATYDHAPSALLEILHDVIDLYGDIPEAAMIAIAGALNLSRAEVYGTKSFYHDFGRVRGDRPRVEICLGESCRACGAGPLFETVKSRLVADGSATVAAVYCLGNCALSPAASVNGVTYGRVDDETVFRLATGGER